MSTLCTLQQGRWLEPYIALLSIACNAVAVFTAKHVRQNAKRLDDLRREE